MTSESMRDMITNPQSQSYQLALRYIREFVQRYKSDPAGYFYDLTNELSLTADFDNVSRCQANPPPWDPHKESCRPLGNYSTDEMVAFLSRLASEIRRLDPDHPISSGLAMPRGNAWHMRERPEWSPQGPSWTQDSIGEFHDILAHMHQGSDIISVHLYNGNQDNERYGITGHSSAEYITVMKQAADRAGKPLFLGEFGDQDPYVYNIHSRSEDLSAMFSHNVLAKVESLRIPYSALWLWEDYMTTLRQYTDEPTGFNVEPGFTDNLIAAVRRTNQNLGNPVPPLPQPDTTPPLIVLTSPLNGASMAMSQPLYAVASDDGGSISRVEFWVDGQLHSVADAPPYAAMLDTSQMADGLHDLAAVAYDLSGNIGQYNAGAMCASGFHAGEPIDAINAGQALRVYPNPWRGGRNQGPVRFGPLPDGAEVKIFTVAGHHVKSVSASGGEALWDLATDSSRRAASGVYLYLVEHNGFKKRGKFSVIR
jgi:hypothetical protein